MVKGFAKTIGYISLTLLTLLLVLFVSSVVREFFGQLAAFAFFVCSTLASLYGIYLLSRHLVEKFTRLCSEREERGRA